MDLHSTRKSKRAKPGAGRMGNLQHIAGAVRPHHQRLHSEPRVIHRARRRGKVKDIVHTPRIEWDANVLLPEFKSRLVRELSQILKRTGTKVIDTQDRMAIRYQCIREMGANEAGSAGNQDTHRIYFISEQPVPHRFEIFMRA